VIEKAMAFPGIRSVPLNKKEIFSRQDIAISVSGIWEKREVDGEYLEKTCSIDTV
jgi:hypothetical protein